MLALLSVGGALFASLTGFSPSIKADPDRAILIAVIIFLVGEVLKLSWQMSSMRQLAKSIDTEMNAVSVVLPRLDQLANLLPVLDKIEVLREKLHTRNDHIGRSGLETVKRMLTLMEAIPEGRGYLVKTETLALNAYEHFWEILRLQQESDPDRRSIVRVTHSSSSDIWDEPQLEKALELQEQFTRAGGIIVRIFLDATEKPSDQLSLQMQKMKSYGMNVFYVRNAKLDQLESDFLWTEPFLVEWISGANRHALLGCRVSEPSQVRKHEIRDQWCGIGRKILNSPDRPSDPEIVKILQHF